MILSIRSEVARRVPAWMMHRYRLLRHVWLAPFEPELAVLPRFLDKQAVAIDIGANVGIYADLLARGSKRVLALEPHPGCAAYLRKLALDRVEIVEAAVSSVDGEASLRIPQDGSADAHALSSLSAANSFGGREGQSVRLERVATTTLDRIGDRLAAERVAFVKIDVEGHELDVLSGARQLLSTHRPVLLVETEFRHGGDPGAVFRLASELGYEAFALIDGRTLEPIDAAQLASRQSPELMRAGRRGGYLNNVFFIPRERTDHRPA
jgi:FkbM family methyltransferase